MSYQQLYFSRDGGQAGRWAGGQAGRRAGGQAGRMDKIGILIIDFHCSICAAKKGNDFHCNFFMA